MSLQFPSLQHWNNIGRTFVGPLGKTVQNSQSSSIENEPLLDL